MCLRRKGVGIQNDHNFLVDPQGGGAGRLGYHVLYPLPKVLWSGYHVTPYPSPMWST